MRRLVIERAADGTPVWAVQVADSYLDKLRGLIGHKPLAAGEGLYFPGTNSIHMLFMGFAIDCVFVRPSVDDGDVHEVVEIRSELRPWTGVVWFVRRAKGAIELGAGSAARAGVNVGDRLRLVTSDA